MKRVIAWVLLLTLCLGLFAGCKKNEVKDPTPTGEATGNVADLEAALEYIKTVYRKPSEKTPKDFQRIGVVPVNGKEYEVVWTADVGEEYIKVVKGTDGMVTIDVNENVEADVKYVLTATISDGGSSVSHSWNHILPAPNNDMVAIVEEAYKLESGKSMDYEVTLTGKITAINTPWDAGYKNITVTIVVEGAEDKPIQCYRLAGDGAENLKPNDIITVTGTLKNYNGTIEFDAGCTLDAVIEGEEIKAPEDPKQILKEAYALAEGGALPYEATLTGVITKVNTEYNPQYKNVTVTMVVGGDNSKPIQCYRLAGDGADKIGKGDSITVTGWIVNYKGTVQFGAGCKLDKWSNTGKDEPKPEDTFTTTLVPEIVTAPKAGVAYKFFFEQKNYGKNMYLTGEMDGYYYATTYDPAKAVDVYLEEVSGGWRAYFMKGGVKNYLEMAVSGTHKNVIFTTSPTKALKWNSEIDTITCDLFFEGEAKDYYWGTYSYYKTFSASDVARVTGADADLEANFVAHFATMKETKVSPEEKAFEQLKLDYPTSSSETHITEENYTRKNVYDIEGTKVKVEWTENSDAVTIVDNGNGTVTVKVTRGDVAAAYTLTATITNGSEKLTTSWKCEIPPKPVAVDDGTYILYLSTEEVVVGVLDETKTYGYIPAIAVTEQGSDLIGFTATALYEIKNGENQTIRLIDSYGRYLYATTYNSFNVAEEAPETGADWVLEKAEGGKFYVRNTETNKYLSYATSYGNFGAYADGTENVVKCAITMKAMTAEDVVITAEMAANALGAEYFETIEDGRELVATYTYEGVEFTVTWIVEPADNAAVKIEGGKLVFEPQDEDVAFVLTAVVANGEDETAVAFDGKVPAATTQLFVPKPVENAEVGVAYKYYMYQATKGVNVYFNGTVSSGYLGTTEDLSEAADVFVEAVEGVEGAVRFYFMDGETKTYIEIFKNSSNKIRQQLVTEATMYYTYDAENNTYVTDIEGTLYYPGTYDSYTTIGASKLSYITGENADKVGVTQYIAKLATLAPAGETVEGVEPPVEMGKGYKYFMYQATLQKAVYFNGTVSSGYLGTTEDLSEAVDVFVEAVEGVEGAVRFYFMDGETKTYIEIFKNSSNKIRQQLVTEATMYYTYDAENKTFVTDIEGILYYPGTYDSYTTIGASKLSYITGENADKVGVTQYIAQFGSVVVKEIAPAVSEPAEAGKAYIYYMYQATKGVNLYFNGTVSSGYLGTTENMDEAVDVFVEAVEGVEGAVRFYFMDGETKTYIEIFKNSSNKIRQQLVTEATMYYTYDAENNTYVTDIEGTLYYPGTYDSYTTIGASKLSYITGENADKVGVTQYIAHLGVFAFVEDAE